LKSFEEKRQKEKKERKEGKRIENFLLRTSESLSLSFSLSLFFFSALFELTVTHSLPFLFVMS